MQPSDPSREASEPGRDDAAPRGDGSSTTDAAPAPVRPIPSDLALELTGALPCVRCTYNLRGLSVAGVCPECGTAIRATILARVDPLAKELQPLHTPRLTAVLLLVWTLGAVLAAVASWVPRAMEGLERIGRPMATAHWPTTLVVVSIALSGLAAVALVRPHRRIPRWQSLAAAGAVLLHVPLLLVVRYIHVALDDQGGGVYFGTRGVDPVRAAWRFVMDVIVLLIIFGLRPNARALAARSHVLRTGQVDRQTMLAMAAAVGVTMVGDLLGVVAPVASGTVADVLRIGALLFVGVGSLLVTLGLGGMVLDAVRIFPVVAAPPLALADIAGPGLAGQVVRGNNEA